MPKKNIIPREKYHYILFLIVAIGTFLRFYNLEGSLPFFAEEAIPWKTSWKFWGFDSGHFSFRPDFLNYPSLYFYIQWIGQALLYLYGRMTGVFSSLADMNAYYEADPTLFIYFGRSITCLFGIASLYVLYRLGRYFFNPEVGLIASLFLALNTLHIAKCQTISVDVPLVFFILLAFIPIWRISIEGKVRDYILSGIVVGLASGTKYTGLFCSIAILGAHLYYHSGKPSGGMVKKLLHPYLWMSAGAVIITFILVSPYCVINFTEFLNSVEFERTRVSLGHFGQVSSANSFFTYVFVIFPDVMSLPVAIVTAIGLIYGLWRFRQSSILLSLFPIIYFLIIGSWRFYAPHYFLPMVPLLYLFVTLVVIEISKVLLMKRAPLLWIPVFTVLLGFPVPGLMSYYANAGIPDNRMLAKNWITENIPSNALIAKELYTPDLENTGLKYFEFPLSTTDPNMFDPLYDYRWYLDFDYLIISSNVSDRYKADPEKFVKQNEFYDFLEQKGALAKKFDATTGGGPEIKIYELVPLNADSTNQDFSPELYNAVASVGSESMVPEFLYQLGTLLEYKNKKRKAMSIYRTVVSVDSSFFPAWANLCLSYSQIGALDSIIVIGEKLLNYAPGTRDMYILFANAYLGKKLYGDALQISETALAKFGNDPELYRIRGLAQIWQENLSGAIISFERAYQLNPNSGENCYNLGFAYYYAGEYRLAAEYANRATDLGYDAAALIDALRKSNSQ